MELRSRECTLGMRGCWHMLALWACEDAGPCLHLEHVRKLAHAWQGFKNWKNTFSSSQVLPPAHHLKILLFLEPLPLCYQSHSTFLKRESLTHSRFLGMGFCILTGTQISLGFPKLLFLQCFICILSKYQFLEVPPLTKWSGLLHHH